jgi:hypothetical protein
MREMTLKGTGERLPLVAASHGAGVPSPASELEADIDWDGPKTHRVLILAPNVGLSGPIETRLIPGRNGVPGRSERLRTVRKAGYREEAWVSAGEAEVLTRRGLAHIMEVKVEAPEAGEARIDRRTNQRARA